jgi:hypothetical protein
MTQTGTRVLPGSAFGVDLDELRSLVERVEAAAEAARAVDEHPGVVRGRAQDSGSTELRDAAVELADRWHEALRRLTGDGERLAAVLRMVLETYAEADRQAASVFPYRVGRGVWGL